MVFIRKKGSYPRFNSGAINNSRIVGSLGRHFGCLLFNHDYTINKIINFPKKTKAYFGPCHYCTKESVCFILKERETYNISIEFEVI